MTTTADFFGSVVPIELHFNIAKPQVFFLSIRTVSGPVPSQATSAEGRCEPCQMMTSSFICVSHGLKHGFSRLIWILDVAMALKGLRNAVSES